MQIALLDSGYGVPIVVIILAAVLVLLLIYVTSQSGFWARYTRARSRRAKLANAQQVIAATETSGQHPMPVPIVLHDSARLVDEVGGRNKRNRRRNRNALPSLNNSYLVAQSYDDYDDYVDYSRSKTPWLTPHARARMQERGGYSRNWKSQLKDIRDNGRQYYDPYTGRDVYSHYGRRVVMEDNRVITYLGRGMHNDRWIYTGG